MALERELSLWALGLQTKSEARNGKKNGKLESAMAGTRGQQVGGRRGFQGIRGRRIFLVFKCGPGCGVGFVVLPLTVQSSRVKQIAYPILLLPDPGRAGAGLASRQLGPPLQKCLKSLSVARRLSHDSR